MGNYTTNPSILLQSNILKKRGDDKYDCIIEKIIVCSNISLQLNELYISIYQARKVSNMCENIVSNKRVIGSKYINKEKRIYGTKISLQLNELYALIGKLKGDQK